jgi:NAD(P)H-hydrate epimerase
LGGDRSAGSDTPAAGGLFYLRDWKLVPAAELQPLTVADVRAIDRIATERYGIPSLLLMERAALGLEVMALEMLRSHGPSEACGDRTAPTALTSEQVIGTSREVVILCGPGANGGDGFALGRMLLERGIPVRVHAAPGAGVSGDAAVNRRAFERIGGLVVASGFRPMGTSTGAEPHEDQLPSPIPSPGRAMPLIVDALFGTGLSRAIEGPAAELVTWANRARAAGARTLAVDIPSGIDSATGEALGPAIEADTTVTFAGAKPGLLTRAGRGRCGRIVVAPIGVERIISASAGAAG